MSAASKSSVYCSFDTVQWGPQSGRAQSQPFCMPVFVRGRHVLGERRSVSGPIPASRGPQSRQTEGPETGATFEQQLACPGAQLAVTLAAPEAVSPPVIG